MLIYFYVDVNFMFWRVLFIFFAGLVFVADDVLMFLLQENCSHKTILALGNFNTSTPGNRVRWGDVNVEVLLISPMRSSLSWIWCCQSCTYDASWYSNRILSHPYALLVLIYNCLIWWFCLAHSVPNPIPHSAVLLFLEIAFWLCWTLQNIVSN